MATEASLIQKRIETLSHFSDHKSILGRSFGTTAFINAGRKIKEYMIQAGLETTVDSIGNVRGRLSSRHPDAKILLIGSHFDTIENSGKYNGTLGVLTGIEAVKRIIKQDISLPYHVEVVAFSGGEGVRFHSAHLGSKALAGAFDEQLLFLEDDKGVVLKDLLKSLNSDYDKISRSVIPREKWLGFMDIHIEPGDQLNKQNIPVAVAEKIYGNKKIDIRFTGKAGHTGSVSMVERRDALAAAAKFVLKVEDYAQRDRNNLLATVSRLQVRNAATNVIPSLVTCSLDIRSMDSEKLSEGYEELYARCERICRKRGIYFDWKLIDETAPVICDENLCHHLSNAIKKNDIAPVLLTSGLVTESTIISKVSPVTMLFIRDSNELSYNPDERVLTEDIQKAVDVTEEFIKTINH